MTQKKLRLLISDSYHLFRECLAEALGRDERFEVVDRAECRDVLVEKLARGTADILLLGAQVLDAELIGLIQEIVARSPAIKILVLGPAEREEHVVNCLLAGAGGVLPRDQSLAQVAAAIEVVARGERVCNPRVMRALFARLADLGRERKRRDRLQILELSAREMEILRLIADDLSNKEIAGRLCLSVHTVKNHVHRILEALEVHSRWGAVNHAFAKGWLQDPRRGHRVSGG